MANSKPIRTAFEHNKFPVFLPFDPFHVKIGPQVHEQQADTFGPLFLVHWTLFEIYTNLHPTTADFCTW